MMLGKHFILFFVFTVSISHESNAFPVKVPFPSCHLFFFVSVVPVVDAAAPPPLVVTGCGAAPANKSSGVTFKDAMTSCSTRRKNAGRSFRH